MAYDIRRIEGRDYTHLSGVFQDAVSEIGRHHYSDAQVEAWLARAPSISVFAELFRDGRHGFVIEGEGEAPLGFADVEPNGHIHFFYCRSALSGTRMADRLLHAIEAVAHEQGLSRLFVEASETARGFFLRNGFREDQRHDFKIDGVATHNYEMSKTLG